MRSAVKTLFISGAMLAFALSCGSPPPRVTLGKAGSAHSDASGKPNKSNGNDGKGIETDSDTNIPFELACTGTQEDPGPAPIQYLTHSQYLNSVTDLIGSVPKLAGSLNLLPNVNALGSGQSLMDKNAVETFFDLADIVADAVVSDPNKLKIIADCEAAAQKRSCLSQKLPAFLVKAFRNDATDAAALEKYLVVYDEGAKTNHARGMNLLVKSIFTSPRFLFRFEYGTGEKIGTTAVKLSGYELATRLSYALWDSGPDATLLEAARSGKLSKAEDISTQIARMMKDPKGAKTLQRFIMSWSHMDRVKTISKDAKQFPAWNPELAESLSAQSNAFLDDWVQNQGASLSSLLTSKKVFVNNATASYYSANAADATFKGMEQTEASGVLTLPAFLAVMSKATQGSPIYRGKFVRENLLCQPLPGAPPGVPEAPVVSATATTRERFSQHSTDPKCAVCHKLIDPVGFAFETYDGIGKSRMTESGKTIDTSGEIFSALGIEGTFVGVPELGKKLTSSPEVEECITRQFFRFIQNRVEKPIDSCTVSATLKKMQDKKGDLNVLPESILNSVPFLYRRPIQN